MKIFNCALALGLLLITPISTARADAPVAFPTVVQKPEGLVFELKLPNGKTSFQIGETIPVRLLFSNTSKQTLYLNGFCQPPPSLLSFASFAVEPKKGASNPLGDLPPTTFISINGYVPKPVLLGEKPQEVRLVLNEYLRFDRPGIYTLRATTSHIIIAPEAAKRPNEESAMFGGNTSVTSPPVTLQIVPADPKWQQEQVMAWRAFWAGLKAGDYEWQRTPGVARPANDLRFLNTRAAAQAMIDRLGGDEFPRSSGSEAYFWRSGLIGFPDRTWLIEAMKSAVKRPDYAVTEGFLDNLATLQGLLHTVHAGRETPDTVFSVASRKAETTNWNFAFDCLSSKKGRTRAITVHSLVESVWLSDLGKVPTIKPRLARLVAMVPDIFPDLSALPQQYLLDDSPHWKEWSLVKTPRMVAPLVRAWKTVQPQQGWAMERGELILRRIVELNPKVGRQLILKEMATPHPRVTFKVLSLLNDKRLPQLQNFWLAQLQKNDSVEDQDTAALLIGRYATPAIKAKVEEVFAYRKQHEMLSFDISRGLNRYLARVH